VNSRKYCTNSVQESEKEENYGIEGPFFEGTTEGPSGQQMDIPYHTLTTPQEIHEYATLWEAVNQ
jgi:hypothetical protein